MASRPTVFFALGTLLTIACDQTPESLRLYIGTYTDTGSEGIYVYQMNPESGELTYETTVAGVVSPSFLVRSPDKKFLYAVNETNDFRGESSGAVSAFRVNRETGELTLLNQQPSHGAHPCHITIDASGKWVLVANYTGGNVAMYPVQADGSLGAASDIVQHEGSGPNTERQEGPHAHSVNISPDTRFVYAADLGTDKIMIYRIEGANGKLVRNEVPFAQTAPGAGPRHLAFHPNGKFVYVINELNSTITAFEQNSANGELTELQTVATLPDDWQGESWCADVHVHPSGDFLYGSNRGHNSIVTYRVDPGTGLLAFVGHETRNIAWPRNFAIEPAGRFMLVANKDSNTVVVFGIDLQTGDLQPTGFSAEVLKPVCILF